MHLLITAVAVVGAAFILVLLVTALFHREYRKTPSGQGVPSRDFATPTRPREPTRQADPAAGSEK